MEIFPSFHVDDFVSPKAICETEMHDRLSEIGRDEVTYILKGHNEVVGLGRTWSPCRILMLIGYSCGPHSECHV